MDDSSSDGERLRAVQRKKKLTQSLKPMGELKVKTGFNMWLKTKMMASKKKKEIEEPTSALVAKKPPSETVFAA